MAETNLKPNSADKMGSASMFKLILSMSLPGMFSMLVQACYNIVDSIFVARLGEYALSALSIVYPIQLFNVALAVGTGIGLSSLISRRLGEKKLSEAEDAAQHGVLLAFLHWLIFLVFGLIGSRAFCALFADSAELLEASVDYCKIVSIGSIFIMTANSLEKVMQAGGNMMASMWCMLSGAITNIILDPIMIFGLLGCPAMGVAGAAYATVIGQLVTLIVAIIFMKKGNLPVKVHFKKFKINGETIKNIYQVGVPSMVMQSIASLTTILLNSILITFGSTAVAVLGVYYKLQSFLFMPIFGMNQGLLPIMGYNYGAKNKERLMDAYKKGTTIAIIIMLIGAAIFKLFPEQIMMLFKAEGDLLTVGVKCLKTISWCFPFAGACIIMGTFFQATAHGFNSMIVSVMRQIIVLIPAAYLLSKAIGLMGIWWAYPCAEVMSTTVSLILFIRLYNKDIKNLQ